MAKTINHFKIEDIDNYLFEIEEAEESLRLLATLCQSNENADFLNPQILKYIGDYLFAHLDRTTAIRHFFLKLELAQRSQEYGIAGEIRKQELKYLS